jgi:hypothetical protein
MLLLFNMKFRFVYDEQDFLFYRNVRIENVLIDQLCKIIMETLIRN